MRKDEYYTMSITEPALSPDDVPVFDPQAPGQQHLLVKIKF